MPSEPIMVILGGGAGSGLHPLTKNRSKAAVPFGGKYRLIDITLSNCLHSECYKIFVLTQYNSGSLNRHIVQTFQMPNFLDGFVDVRAASMTPENPYWYQGTADAVRQNLDVIRGAAEISGVERIIILSGDHLYQMDYRDVLEFHEQNEAEVTLCVHPVSRVRVSTLGTVQIDEDKRVTRFVEKPHDEFVIDSLRQDPAPSPDQEFFGSMGLYVFELPVLERILQDHSEFNEFGRHVVPHLIEKHRVFAYPFNGFWENVGTIRSFYDAMVQLTRPNPTFDFDQTDSSLRRHFLSRSRSLPPAKINGAQLEDSILGEGAIIDEGTKIYRSIVGMRAFVDKNVHIEDSMLFGCDFYQSIQERQGNLQRGTVPLGIGEGSVLRRCIIDKNVRIGRQVILENNANVSHADHEKYSIRDGIIVVPKEVTIEDHFRAAEA